MTTAPVDWTGIREIHARRDAQDRIASMTPSLLAAWRARMGWTAKRAAQELGLSVNGYAAYERGWVQTKAGPKARPVKSQTALACHLLEQLQKAS